VASPYHSPQRALDFEGPLPTSDAYLTRAAAQATRSAQAALDESVRAQYRATQQTLL
jgi:hypothetical protein